MGEHVVIWHDDPSKMCSQCGERLAVMVKIGTEDGWCEACLDAAAEPPASPTRSEP